MNAWRSISGCKWISWKVCILCLSVVKNANFVGWLARMMNESGLRFYSGSENLHLFIKFVPCENSRLERAIPSLIFHYQDSCHIEFLLLV